MGRRKWERDDEEGIGQVAEGEEKGYNKFLGTVLLVPCSLSSLWFCLLRVSRCLLTL